MVPKQHVKTVKTALEQHCRFDQTAKITPDINTRPLPNSNADTEVSRDGTEIKGSSKQEEGGSKDRMRIPTTIPYPTDDTSANKNTENIQLEIFHDLGLSHISDNISFTYHTPSAINPPPTLKNPLHKALAAALSTLDPSLLTNLNLTPSALTTSFPESYSIYPPLLLLPPNTFTSPSWTLFLASHPLQSRTLHPLWHHLSTSLKVTHIAINSPIPLQSSSSANILRSPVNITPLHGDFGPAPTSRTLTAPTQKDFEDALWVSTVQNGITQVWAPMYTMFSRGNIREKTRLLQLSSITSLSNAGAAVVDMYAGIGYFAFSYRAAGMRPVIGFELNPWSVEGLRRGAAKNGWAVKIYKEGEGGNMDLGRGGDGDVDFHIFLQSNVHAVSLLTPYLQAKSTPPIRHINLGLLPHSRNTWRDAVQLLDRKAGGWVHAHENVGVEEIEGRRGEIEGLFRGYVDEVFGTGVRKVEVEHVERVKMYAPGVVHCVFDVRVGGKGAKEGR